MAENYVTRLSTDDEVVIKGTPTMGDSTSNNKKRIVELKCEIFDIIRQQELLNSQISQLQNMKAQKFQELQKLESD